MLKEVKNIEKNVVELEITVSAEDFEVALEKAYRKNIKNMNIPGFRRGKAPRKFVEKMYGEEVFFEQAVNDTYPEAYENAIKEGKINPVDRASIEVVDVSKDGYTFKATVTVKPEVELSQYKELAVEKVKVNVTDADVDAEIEAIRQRYGRLITVSDRAAQLDDTVVIDFEGFVDGVAFEGGKGENHNLKLGSGQFIPGFEDQIVGKNTGDTFDVNVTFPKEYHAEDLSGKDAVFKVTLKEIKVTELPALDDEFAKDASEFDTFEEYKKATKDRLTENKERQSDMDVENDILKALSDNMTADIPQVMIDNQVENLIKDYDQRLHMQGLSLEMYLQYTGGDMDSFKKMFEEQAVSNVRTRLALEKVVELEKIVVSDEEINDEIKLMADEYKMEVEKIKAFVPAEELAADIAVRKAIECVKNNAVITEVAKKKAPAAPKAKKTTAKKDADAPAEKKPAAKKTTTAKKTTAKKDADAPAEKKPAAKKTTTKKAADKEKAE